MVKVAENRVVDLDVFPGDPKCDKLAEQTKGAIAGEIPRERAHGTSANTQSAITALGGTVGGGLKGVVDTIGNTVGTLGEGAAGTVQGVGDGIGSTVQFAGGAVGAGVGQVGTEAVETQKANLQAASKKTDEIEADVSTSVQEHSKDANTAVKQTRQHGDSVSYQAEDKITAVLSSSS
ncbi:uncharacterized protein A1O9_02271 [Exophiala aquamarina CBS 119918]|uniref:Uncharacterized protein n=1 Tax=Exophiala aquamarina CBS 119918 TaxID=1182545 RepID=A0A072PYM4_9EURO|nr:uncharacterized protein A1O9_02271 [Exophiala aquamarina CBS 119918]KEF60710.1 hypothetical protein A1O9_02271 [Exophiala aquamarina CBS 119918]